MLFASLNENSPGSALGGRRITAIGGVPSASRAMMKSCAVGPSSDNDSSGESVTLSLISGPVTGAPLASA